MRDDLGKEGRLQEGFKGDELKACLMYSVVMGLGTALYSIGTTLGAAL